MSSYLSIGSQAVLMQLAMMKFHDRRERAKAHPNGKKRAKPNKRAAIDSIVLHAMSFDRGNSITAYDGVNCHFAVLRSGDILYLHDVSEYLFASHDFNDRGIAIEFAGNPPAENGKAYKPEKFGKHIPTRMQMLAGRKLVEMLARVYNLRNIYGHKQSCRKICPGPHVWYNVGRWAVNNLGLSDGGPRFKTSNEYCGGVAIPSSWDDPKFDLFSLEPIMDYLTAALSSPTPIP